MKKTSGFMMFVMCATLFVSGCSEWLADSGLEVENPEYVQDPSNPSRIISKKQAEQAGGTLNLFNGNPTEDEEAFQVNKYLWDACLDTLSDLPTKVSDSAVGLYETDYVANAKGQVKVRCRIKGSKILSENLEVTVFERKNADSPVKSLQDNILKSNILLRARELRTKNLSQE